MREFESRAENGSAPTRGETPPTNTQECSECGRQRLPAGLTTINQRDYCPNCAPDELEASTAHHLLRVPRRRHIIQILATLDAPSIEKDALVDRVTTHETNPDERASGSPRKTVYISLHQDHLPLLDEHDVIDYDDPVIEPTPLAHTLHHAAREFTTAITEGADA